MNEPIKVKAIEVSELSDLLKSDLRDRFGGNYIQEDVISRLDQSGVCVIAFAMPYSDGKTILTRVFLPGQESGQHQHQGGQGSQPGGGEFTEAWQPMAWDTYNALRDATNSDGTVKIAGKSLSVTPLQSDPSTGSQGSY